MSTLTIARGIVPDVGFAIRIRLARLHAGLTQEQMAAELGMKKSAYGHYESGQSEPRNMRQFSLAVFAATGIDANWLMHGYVPQFDDNPDGGQELPLMDSNHQPCGQRSAIIIPFPQYVPQRERRAS